MQRYFTEKPEAHDPTSGQRDATKLADMLYTFSNGSRRRKMAYVFNWAKPTIKALAFARRDKLAPATRSEIVKGPWNEIYSRHRHGEKFLDRLIKGKYVANELVKVGAHDLDDCYCMDLVHALRRGWLNLAAEVVNEPGK